MNEVEMTSRKYMIYQTKNELLNRREKRRKKDTVSVEAKSDNKFVSTAYINSLKKKSKVEEARFLSNINALGMDHVVVKPLDYE